MRVGELLVHIGADTGDFQRDLDKGEQASARFSQRVIGNMNRIAESAKHIGEIMVTAFAFDKLKDKGKEMLNLAMEAENSEATFKQVFGNMAADAQKFSDAFSKAMGANSIEVRKQMSVTDAIVKGMGLTDKTAAEMSKGIQQMTYDLSAFRDMSIEDAFYKLRSGLTGETEPLKEVGILVLENTIKETAYRKGIAKTGAELTEQQKVLARYATIQESLVKQGGNGQWVREMSSASAQLKIAKARYEETAAVLGQKLIPVFTKLLNMLNYVIDKFNKLPDGVKTSILWFGVALTAVVGLTFALSTLGFMISGVTTAFLTFKKLGTAVSIVSRLGSVVAGVVPLLSRLWTLLRTIAIVGGRFAGPIGIILSFVLLGLQSDVAQKKVKSLWETVKAFLGFNNNATQAQADASQAAIDAAQQAKDAQDAYNKTIEDTTGGLGSAKKAADKFLASFDEVYQIPDNNNDQTTGLPLPTVPTPPATATPAPGGGQELGTDWIDELLKKIALIPKAIDMPTINPPSPPDGGAGAVATAWTLTSNQLMQNGKSLESTWQKMLDKIGETNPAAIGAATAVDEMLKGMNGGVAANAPLVMAAINTVSDAIKAVETNSPLASGSFSSMHTSMLETSQASSPVVVSSLDRILQATGLMKPTSAYASQSFNDMYTSLDATQTNFNPLLEDNFNFMYSKMNELEPTATNVNDLWNAMYTKFQSDQNAFNPFLLWGFALLFSKIAELEPTSAAATSIWNAMYTAFQSDQNAFNPYLLYGFSILELGIAGLVSQLITSQVDWSKGWQGIADVVSAKVSSILDMIKKAKNAYNDLLDTIGEKRKQTQEQTATDSRPVYGPAIPEKMPIGQVITEFDYAQAAKQAAVDFGKSWVSIMDGLSSDWIASHPELGQGVNVGGVASGVGAGANAAASKLQQILEALKQMGQGGSLAGVTGFASGGVIGSDSIVRVGERGRKEAIVPLESGSMNPFADAVASRIGSNGSMGGGGDTRGRDVFIGTFSDRGVKELVRAIKGIQMNDSSRGLNS